MSSSLMSQNVVGFFHGKQKSDEFLLYFCSHILAKFLVVNTRVRLYIYICLFHVNLLLLLFSFVNINCFQIHPPH